jgi:hypothetical protein
VGLTPSGSPNPIGSLYDLISDGLHERTEEECIEIFDRCKAAFEYAVVPVVALRAKSRTPPPQLERPRGVRLYVIRKLTEAKREDEAYIQAVRKLSQQGQSK